MKRREALKSGGILLAAGMSVATVNQILTGCRPSDTPDVSWSPAYYSQDEIKTLAELAERIIPKTDTPGAKDAMVHRDIDSFAAIAMNPEEHELIKVGLADINATSEEKFGMAYHDISDDERDDILMVLANEAEALEDEDAEMNFFNTIKALVVYTYGTSEVGATEFLKFDPIPGQYAGCIPFDQVNGVWAL